MSEIRRTEPKPIQDILAETMAAIKERSNINYETAIVHRETAAGTAYRPGIDFMTGDYVQVRSGEHAGKCGRIIGVKYSDGRRGSTNGLLLYTIQLSNLEAVHLPAGRLRFLNEGTPTNEEF